MLQDQKDSDLYVIGEGGNSRVVKIGKSNNVKSRLATLQTGSPTRLQILHVEPGAGHLETSVHDRFAGIRLSGEWFNFGPGEDPVALVVEAVKDLTPPVIYTQGDLDRAIAEARKQAKEETLAEAGARIRQERDRVTRERDQHWQGRLNSARTQHQQDLDRLQAQYVKRENDQADRYEAQQAEWAKQITRLQGDMAKLTESLAAPRFQELASYAQDQVRAHSGELAPGLTDYVLGSTKKEIGTSVARAIKMTEHFKETGTDIPVFDQPSGTQGDLTGVDTELYTELVQQVFVQQPFVPRMPTRRVVPELTETA